MEVLQERQRKDALLCPGSRFQWVGIVFHSRVLIDSFILPIKDGKLCVNSGLQGSSRSILQTAGSLCPHLFLRPPSPHLFSCMCPNTKAPLKCCKVDMATGFLGPYSSNFLCRCFFVTLGCKWGTVVSGNFHYDKNGNSLGDDQNMNVPVCSMKYVLPGICGSSWLIERCPNIQYYAPFCRYWRENRGTALPGSKWRWLNENEDGDGEDVHGFRTPGCQRRTANISTCYQQHRHRQV